jgi:hypothetical protein
MSTNRLTSDIQAVADRNDLVRARSRPVGTRIMRLSPDEMTAEEWYTLIHFFYVRPFHRPHRTTWRA